MDWRKRRARAAELLARVGAEIAPQTEVRSLSMPEQQLVEIACALGAGARVVIMDEPTASLTRREQERLYAVVRDLRAAGVTFDARTAKSGNWSDPATWENNKPPAAGQRVQVRAGHVVTYDVTPDKCTFALRMVHVAGTLSFSRGRKGNSWLTVPVFGSSTRRP